MLINLKKLGPGLLFAGAAIGVSHLVQSTRAGASFGFGLLWALLAINLVKYPFFQFAPRYAMATGESLLEGYYKLGKWVVAIYFIISLATIFTIQTAVTIVTAGLASSIFGLNFPIEIWTLIILAICFTILLKGSYALLDKLMKVIIITLTASTILAVSIAVLKNQQPVTFRQIIPESAIGIGFLIAFMGWMPAPLDVSIWQSLWNLEKRKTQKEVTVASSILDFNVGYFATIFIGIGFIALGTLVMNQTGQNFSPKAGEFANQLINIYTQNLGGWSYAIIGIAAFTTMFSTTLTTLDASPRSMHKASQLLFNQPQKKGYLFWLIILTLGTLIIFFFLASEMGLLIQVATILSFLTAPFYAAINYWLISSKHTPKKWHPSKTMHSLSIIGIIFLVGFSIWYLTTL